MEPPFSNLKRTPQCSAVTFHRMTSTLSLVPVTRKPSFTKSSTSELVIIDLSHILCSLYVVCVLLCDRRPCTNLVKLFREHTASSSSSSPKPARHLYHTKCYIPTASPKQVLYIYLTMTTPTWCEFVQEEAAAAQDLSLSGTQ